jgi:3-oxoacyl-[acyl-carrier-protein] synthase-3
LIETSSEVAAMTGIPEEVVREKLGIHQRHVAAPDDTISAMASKAALRALEHAGISGDQVALVISHGSEYKDHILWNAAGKIQDNIGADTAYAFEVYALCGGGVIAINTARSMMAFDERLEYVVLAAASRENELVSYQNPKARFMYNFGSGASALVLKRDAEKNHVLGASYITDGTLSETLLFGRDEEALGGEDPDLGDIHGRLTVYNYEYMSDRLGEVSFSNYMKVIREAVERSDARMEDVRFLGISQMKPSFHRAILAEMGLTEDQTVILWDYGHIQTVDQVLALELGVAQGKVREGDLIVLAAAGAGYTWGAICVRWG